MTTCRSSRPSKTEPRFAGEAPGERVRIGYRLTNRTDRTLFLNVGCGTVAVDRLEGDEWVNVWPPPDLICALIGIPPVWLAPGEPFLDVLDVRRSPLWVSGHHRVRLNELFAEEGGRGEFDSDEPLPLPMRVSELFMLTLPDSIS